MSPIKRFLNVEIRVQTWASGFASALFALVLFCDLPGD